MHISLNVNHVLVLVLSIFLSATQIHSQAINSISSSCHGLYYNTSDSEAVTGTPNRTATAPSTPSISTSLSPLVSSECHGVVISWLPPESDRDITQYYLYRNNSIIANLSNSTTQYTDSDQLSLNTDYQYSLVAENCAGNSTMGNASASIPAVKINLPSPVAISILPNGSIGVSTDKSPHLSYDITLIKSNASTVNQTVGTIQDPTHSFSAAFSLDTCYHTRTRIRNCTHESGYVLSRGFILHRLNLSVNENKTYFQQTTNNLTRFYFSRDSVMNISCSYEDYEPPFLTSGLITFQLIRDGVSILNVSNITVISPFSYEFYVPEELHNCVVDTFLRMTYKGDTMSNLDVLFCYNNQTVVNNTAVVLGPTLSPIGFILLAILVVCIL